MRQRCSTDRPAAGPNLRPAAFGCSLTPWLTLVNEGMAACAKLQRGGRQIPGSETETAAASFADRSAPVKPEITSNQIFTDE
ncbi:unnamed protein product [Coccothraustes coccothraustes]